MFLPRNDEPDVPEAFEIHEFRDVVASGKSRDARLFVFRDAAKEIAGHADVENARCARHDVDVVGLHRRCHRARLYALWQGP